MATIPLSQIPNAPDLASMARPQTNEVNVPMVDFGGERAAVARGYAGAEQSPNNAGLVGGAVAEVGQGVYKAAKTLADKQQELNDNAAWAEFSTNYTLQKGDLDDSLLKSDPTTWASSYANFRAKNIDPMWAALPVSVQQRHYGDYLKLTSEDQIRVSHAAFQKNVADSTAKSLTDINLQIEKNDFAGALTKLDELKAVNGIGGKEYEAQKSQIQTSSQIHDLYQSIALDPLGVKRRIEDATSKDEILQEYPNIGKDELNKIATKAQKVFEVQQDRNYGDVSTDIATGKLKSVVDLEKDPRFSKVADEKSREALKESIADRWLYTKEGESFTKVAMNTVKGYPQTDAPAQEAMEIRRFVNSNVPSIYRDAINKELDSKINEMASNGGRLKPETELVQYGTQRLKVARDGGVFGKFYSDKEVKEDSSGKKAKANIEVMKQIEDVELQLRNSGVKTRSDADKVIEEATAAGRAKKAAGEIGNQKGWFDFLKSRKPQASNDSVSESTMKFVIGQEGFTPNRYTDSDKDKGSIGYGTYAEDGETTISEDKAKERLNKELSGHQKSIVDAASSVGLNLTESQKTALTSFDFNTGAGAKVVKESGGDWSKIKSKIAEYKYATIKGVKKPILENRRNAELRLLASQPMTEDGQG